MKVAIKVKLVGFRRTRSFTPISWILTLFESLLRSNQSSYPLQYITIELFIIYADLRDPMWDHWVAFDVLLGKPEFGSLKMVHIILTTPMLSDGRVVLDILNGKLPFLKRSNKLKLSIDTD